MSAPIWFWQRIVSPHMAGLAEALARQGRKVTYVAEQSMSAERAAQGWNTPILRAADLRFAPDANSMTKLASEAPADSIHICQGFRGNGQVGVARRALARRGLRQWVIAETVEKKGGWMASRIKRLEYARLIHLWRGRIEGVLAIGDTTPRWFADRGMPCEKIFPFAYFLPEGTALTSCDRAVGAPFRVLFVGRVIPLKGVDILIDALARLNEFSFELVVVGDGPLVQTLCLKAEAQLGERAIWLGQRPMQEIPTLMAEADCLVLPSNYDGWGAVVSEALMVGTPAICSDRCGAATVVRASGSGGVFGVGDVDALSRLLGDTMAKGPHTGDQRSALAKWAGCLSATAGATYLDAILRHAFKDMTRVPPWERTSNG